MTAKKSKKARGPGATAEASTKPAATAVSPPAANKRKAPAPPAGPPPEPIIGRSLGSMDKPGPHSARTRWLILAAILGAWAFGFGARALWLSDANEVPDSSFEGKRLLTTADAYFYASGVKHEVDGSLSGNPRVPTNEDNILVAIGSTIANVFGVPVETVCQWMPAFMAPLVAIPLVLLGVLFGQLLWGFLASLVAVLGFSFWNRTVPGYFDTDMVTILYILGSMTLVMAGFWRRRTLYGTIAAMMLVAAPYIHPGSERVLAAMSLGAFGYALVFERRQPHAYRIALALLIAFLPIPIWARLTLIGGLELALSRVKIPLWALISLVVAVLLIVCWKGRSMELVLKVVGIRLDGGGHSNGLKVSFPGIQDTVAELAHPTVDKLGERLSGSALLVVTGAIGFFAACWRFRPLLLLLPLLALGTVLAVGGMRYTIFAVPVIALGNIWLMLISGRIVARFVPPKAVGSPPASVGRPRLIELAVATLLAPIAIGPAIAHAGRYPARTALGGQEASQLTALSKRVKPGDFIMTWWDYAYGAWYHSGLNTLVDGTKQNDDLWIAAEVLFTKSQREAASLTRLAVEEQTRRNPLDAVIGHLLATFTKTTGRPIGDFVPALRNGEVQLPTPTRQIFFYLPWRIVQIAPNVARIRPSKDLVPADELAPTAFLVVNQYRRDGSAIAPSGWTYDPTSKSLVSQRGERIKVHTITDVAADGSGRVRSRDTVVDPDGKVCIVNIKHAGMTLFMSRAVYDSVLSQLLFLARPDLSLFEVVSYTSSGVVYRVLP